MKKTLLIVVFIQFIVYAGFGMVIPVMPEIVTELSGIAGHIGGMLAIYSVASFITSPSWGALADRKGRRLVLIIGLIGYAVGFFIFAIFIDSLMMMYLSRFVSGIFAGALYAAAMSTLSDISDDTTRNRNLGLAGMAIGLGFIFGPATGGLLSLVSLAAPFYLAGTLMLLLVPIVLITVKDAYWVPVVEVDKSRLLPKLELPDAGLLKLLLFMSFTASFLLTGLESVFQVFGIDQIAMTPAEMGLLFFIGGTALAIVQGGFLRKIKTGKEYIWITVGQVMSGLAFVLMVVHFNLILAGVYLILFIVGNAMIRTLSLSLITRASGNRSGYASGLQFSADSLGRIFGPLVFAFTYDVLSGTIFLIAGGISFILIIVILFNRSRLAQIEAA
ncbi:MFS transporter [Salisediminibacterium beveridgei]|uniref:Quinolone resistance protein norA n=1 Tax=Salisediminibacterium beveridgei TaxID=632773 RepID=A0A1D7QTT3_9BACI|nr:MFS transporter [Salisediminibacterium beveridgei]AOM82426.1 Quinolone resistance protein norA [Salisediminibacterium beveridgei]